MTVKKKSATSLRREDGASPVRIRQLNGCEVPAPALPIENVVGGAGGARGVMMGLWCDLSVILRTAEQHEAQFSFSIILSILDKYYVHTSAAHCLLYSHPLKN